MCIAALAAAVVTACSTSDETVTPPATTGGGGSVSESTSTEASTTEPTTTTTTTTAEPTTTEPTTTTTTEPPRTIEDIGLHELQVIGSHNSYHLAPAGPVADGLEALVPDFAASLAYTHPPLGEQLEEFGLRQLELDVYADPEGGHYSSRQGLTVVGQPAESGLAALDEPGFKVLHIQDVDFGTTCLTLVACLSEIEAWSAANPRHVPLHIMIEIKEETIEEIAENGGFELPDLGVEWTVPIPMTTELLAALAEEVLTVFDRGKIITPDDVRGPHETLAIAVATDGWPTLGTSRGKVILSLLSEESTAELYRSGAPTLEGWPFFPLAEPGAPDAAIVGIDDPVAGTDAIARAVADGALVRTRSDASTTPDGDTSRRDAALASGAHYVSSDVYEDVGRGFVVRLPDDAVARCNPVSASAWCVDADLVDP